VGSDEDPNADPITRQNHFAISMITYCRHQIHFELYVQSGIHVRYISPPHLVKREEWETCHPFRVIGKFLFNAPDFPISGKTYYLEQFYSRAQQYNLAIKAEQSAYLEEIVRNLPGNISLFITRYPNNLQLQYDCNGVAALVWIPPWSVDVFWRCNYIELDTSFRALKPYVYCIPLAIHANEAFPLALIVGLSETVELYNLFFNAMDSIGITRELIIQKPFLTDQHKALKTACAGSTHFICLRHLIENFGARSFIGQIVRRLAFSTTPTEFLYQAHVSVQDIIALQERGALNEKHVKKLFKRFGTLGPGDQMNFSLDTWNDQAIWTRATRGVSTCSNHIEGFHRSLNEATSRHVMLTRRLYKVLKCIQKRYEFAQLYQHSQGTKLLKKLRIKQKSLRLIRCDECHDTRCGWKAYYSSLFLTDFPCIHEVGSRTVTWYHPEQDELDVVVNDILEIKEYRGTWRIPNTDDADTVDKKTNENEWYRDS
jgi:hypothetical protein